MEEEPEYNFELLEELVLAGKSPMDLSKYQGYDLNKRHKERYSDRIHLLKSFRSGKTNKNVLRTLRNAIDHKCYSEMN